MKELFGFMHKEVRHILRDRRTLTILLLLPLAQVLLFGYAVRTDIDSIRVIVVDPAPDAQSLSLQARLRGTPVFEVIDRVASASLLPAFFEAGRADMAIVFPPNFGSLVQRPGVTPVQIITDATDPNTGSTIQAYASAVVAQWQQSRSAPGAVQIRAETQMRFNPTLESVNLFVPGLIAVLLTVVSALMSAISLSTEKERGTLEVLLVSPLRPSQIIIGKVLPYMVLGFINVASVLLAAWLVFGVPFRGSLPLLLAECLLFIVASLALGVLVAAITTSQRTAMVGALMGLMLPTLLLSGMIFPISSMPIWLQGISNVVPGRWFLLIARGIMLKGVGFAELWQETAVLAGMTSVFLMASVRAFDIRLT